MKHHGSSISLLLVICITSLLQAEIITEYGSLQGFLLGVEPGCAYDNYVTHVVEGVVEPDYNDYNPHDHQSSGFGNFENIPGGGEGDALLGNWLQLFQQMMLQEWEEAENLRETTLSAYPYEIVHLLDTLAAREWYLVREQLNLSYYDINHPLIPEDDEEGSFDFGWGLYVFAVGAEHPYVAVELVHPCDDYIAPYSTYDMFETLDAGALFFNGAGREAAWTEEGDYSNSKSLSDASRNSRHVLHQAHVAFVDYWIYESHTGLQPLPIQVHSYDTEGRDLFSVIVTPGRYDRTYNLPVYDWSGQLGGMIDRTPCVVHPPGFIGNADTVRITEYYGANSFQLLEVCDGLTISNSNDLLGFGGNVQLSYLDGLRDYCTDPEWVLHVELDELPDCIGDSTEYAFYAEPGYPLTWQNFAPVTAYYHPVSSHLRAALDTIAVYEDVLPPLPPEQLHLVQSHGDRIDLGWERASDPWFYSYRLYYSTTPGVDVSCPYIGRDDYYPFCMPACEALTFSDLPFETTWYFRLVALDRELRMSSFTEELAVTTVDTDPPLLVVDLPAGYQSTWWNGSNGFIRVEISDDFSLVEGSAVEYRRDYNQDGSYDGLAEMWFAAPVVPDTNPLTVVIEFDYAAPPQGACFEIRARDMTSQVWGYSGKDNSAGIDDDYQIFQDDQNPVSPTAFFVDSLNLEGWFTINWLGIAEDTTFASYLLHYSREETDTNSLLLDRFDIDELGDINSGSAGVTQIDEPGGWWLRLGTVDWASNRSTLTAPLYILHPGQSGVAIVDLVINCSEEMVNITWGVATAENFTGTIVGYEVHRSVEPLFQPAPSTLLATVTQPQYSEALASATAFYRVIALVE